MAEAETIKVTAEQLGRVGDPCVMVIFGASGDLTKRKLIPALYNLARDGLLSEQFAVVGFARSGMSNEAFRDKLTREMKEFGTGPFDPDLWQRFVQRLYYLSGDIQDDNAFQQLQGQLAGIDKEHGTQGNYFYYLATSPDFFPPIVQRLAAARVFRSASAPRYPDR
jgi:glucose-6-phosphate 1-dehydrogenase